MRENPISWWDFCNNFIRFGKWTWNLETDEELYERLGETLEDLRRDRHSFEKERTYTS